MDQVRYFLGVLFVVSVPPAVVFWLLVHPFVRWWRRIGALFTYLLMGIAFSVMVLILYRFRQDLLGADLGASGVLITLGVLVYLASAWLSLLIKRHLDTRTLAGLPELTWDGDGGTLIQEGVYGVVRHPRYLAVIIGTAGFALVVNYLGVYLVWLASVVALLLVVTLEERELTDRFGAQYEEYRSRVPALIPKLRR